MSKERVVRFISIGAGEVIALGLLAAILPGLTVTSLPTAILAVLMFSVFQALFWLVFIHFAARLHPFLYPVLTFGLSGVFVVLIHTVVPGFSVNNVLTGIWVVVGLTAASTLVGFVMSIEEEDWFDHNVTRNMVKRYGRPIVTEKPGLLCVEIDGLSEPILRQAIAKGYMPTLKRWLDAGTHRLITWETDLSSQTAAMQAGILHGNNYNVPAYRWFDRTRKRLVISGNPFDAHKIEHELSDGRGLLANGGASRANMFSGDAVESLFTFSTLFDKSRRTSPGFYLFLLSPYVVTRLVTRFFIEFVVEFWDAWQQRRRKDPLRIAKRRFPYPLLRAFMVSTLQELATYTTISDLLRGLPAIYTLFAGYDDVGHFAGMNRPEAFKVLRKTDRYLERIERALEQAPRPYKVVVLSDHGQSQGMHFKAKYGKSLEEVVKELVASDELVFAAPELNEAWASINAVLSDVIQQDLRTSKVLRRTLRRKVHEGYVTLGPKEALLGKDIVTDVVVIASGSLGLIYYAKAKTRLSYEEIQEAVPALIPGLVSHPGIGFVLVNSERYGGLAIGAKGIHFLDQDRVEGEDPLAPYGPHAAKHLRRANRFPNQADILVQSAYDPETQEISSFEEQVGHHGGLGGFQTQPFLLYPAELPLPDEPIVGAKMIHEILCNWRRMMQGDFSLPPTSAEEKPTFHNDHE